MLKWSRLWNLRLFNNPNNWYRYWNKRSIKVKTVSSIRYS